MTATARDPGSRALALRVAATGTRPALRVKRRDRWRTITWNEFAGLVADPPAASGGLDAPAIARAVPGLDAARLASAEDRVRARRLGPADVALVIEPAAWDDHAPDVLAEWLVAGFVLALPETVDSVGVDLREVQPTYVFAHARTFAAIYAETEARLPPPGTWRRRLIDRALGSTGVFADLLVQRPLRRTIGWARVRAAVAVNGTLDPGAALFFAALGVPVRAPGDSITDLPAIRVPAAIAAPLSHGEGL